MANLVARHVQETKDDVEQMNTASQQMVAAAEKIRELRERIERLEQAGDAMADVLVWSSGTQYKRSPTASAWRKAKEAKP